MLLSVALLILGGFLLAEICYYVKLPRLIGFLLMGIFMGPYVFDLIAPELQAISADLRLMALVIILIRAGLALHLEDFKQMGKPALKMAFLPATFEMVFIVLAAPWLLGLSWVEAFMLGAIIAAVSPAVVIPKMLDMIANEEGTDKRIPQLLIASASVEDIFVIIVFTTVVGFYQTGSISTLSLLSIPLGIVAGIGMGMGVSYLLVRMFKRFSIRDSKKVLIILGSAILMMVLDDGLIGIVPFSGLIAVIALSLGLFYFYPILAKRLVKKFEKVWILAELMLFALVGALVDIRLISLLGLSAIVLLVLSLSFRSLGTFMASKQKQFNSKEQAFIIASYLPKATVQASIGAIPLALGVPNGDVILAIAVLAILITAPLGSLITDIGRKRLLSPSQNS